MMKSLCLTSHDAKHRAGILMDSLVRLFTECYKADHFGHEPFNVSLALMFNALDMCDLSANHLHGADVVMSYIMFSVIPACLVWQMLNGQLNGSWNLLGIVSIFGLLFLLTGAIKAHRFIKRLDAHQYGPYEAIRHQIAMLHWCVHQDQL